MRPYGAISTIKQIKKFDRSDNRIVYLVYDFLDYYSRQEDYDEIRKFLKNINLENFDYLSMRVLFDRVHKNQNLNNEINILYNQIIEQCILQSVDPAAIMYFIEKYRVEVYGN